MSEQSPGPAPIRQFDIELVEEVTPPKKAPPPRAAWEQGQQTETAVPAPTEPSYLQEFLHENDQASSDLADVELYEAIVAALRDIYDPEIPVNIYDLGLIYNIENDGGHITVTMTLTTPNCPVAESMPGEVELRVLSVPGVATCDVNLVWDPAWNPGNMSDEAKLELGML